MRNKWNQPYAAPKIMPVTKSLPNLLKDTIIKNNWYRESQDLDLVLSDPLPIVSP